MVGADLHISFDNKLIKPTVKDKPHISLMRGYWRVSQLKKSNRHNSNIYHKAHAFIYKLNSVIHHEKTKISKL
jgi:predicted helicase